jgi:SM-20-related protein
VPDEGVRFIDIVEEHPLRKPAERAAKAVERFSWKYGWISNINLESVTPHWHHEILGPDRTNEVDMTHVLMDQRADHTDIAEFWAATSRYFFPHGAALFRAYANAHTFGTEGYPHTDSNHQDDVTLMLYCVKPWKREWGGETLIWKAGGFDAELIESAILPAPFRLVLFPSSRWHVGRGMTRICKELRVVLVFKCRPRSRA